MPQQFDYEDVLLAREQGYREGYHDGLMRGMEGAGMNPRGMMEQGLEFRSFGNPEAAPKPKRKVSAYHKKLGREIKRLRRLHLTKAGKWKKGWSQRRLMKTAHKNTK